MLRTATALSITTLALISACYGTSASDEEAAGGAGTGGTNSAGARAGNTSRGGSEAGGSEAGGSEAGGSDAGGSDVGGANTGGDTGIGGAPPWEVWQACTLDEDCTVVPQNGCCGCVPTGVNTEYEAEAIEANASFDASQCPPGLGCPSMPCPPDSMVACELGVCTPKPGCSERSEQDCDLDGKCEKYEARLCGTPGAFAYFACGQPRNGCTAAQTCVVSPFGQEVLFPDGCVPDGYTQPCVSECL